MDALGFRDGVLLFLRSRLEAPTPGLAPCLVFFSRIKWEQHFEVCQNRKCLWCRVFTMKFVPEREGDVRGMLR